MGHRTVFVSASLASYLDPLAQSLGVERALCTDVAIDAGEGDAGDDAVYADRLAGPNCRAEEKLVRLRRWLDDEDIGEAEIWAYGDSRGDRELLAAAHHPTWVRGVTISAVPAEVA
jgi:phosphatidylglycerophosphatase C